MKKIILFLFSIFFLSGAVMYYSYGAYNSPSSSADGDAGTVVCTQEAKLCSDGVTYVSRTGPNCEFETCPDTTKPKVCTREYMPVCGQPKMPICTAGLACPAVMPLPKTYSNKCTLEAEGATYLYGGECKGGMTICPIADPLPEKEGCKNIIITDSIGCKSYKQICKEKPVCPVYDVQVPGEGCYYEWIKDNNGCKKPKLVCKEKPVCPVEDALPPKEGCKNVPITKENGCKGWKQICEEKKVCTQEYSPVCGQPKTPICTNILTCPNYFIPPKTYPNKCSLKADGAEFLYEGECRKGNVCPTYSKVHPEPGCTVTYETDSDGCKIQKVVCEDRKVCTQEYAPVCGEVQVNMCPPGAMCPASLPKRNTYGNMCELTSAGANFLYKGECRDDQTTICTDYSNVKLASSMNGCPIKWYTDGNSCKAYKYECKATDNNDSLTQKLKEALKKLYNRLDASGKTNAEKIAYLETIYAKLKSLLQNNPKSSQQIQVVLTYVSEKIAEYKNADDDNSLDEIFNIIR